MENDDPFDLLIPMERVTMKVGISNRLYKLIKGEEVIGEDDKRRLDLEHKESEMRKSYLEKRQNLLSPANKHNGGKKKSMFAEEGSEGGEGESVRGGDVCKLYVILTRRFSRRSR